jgi:hypothetical protein
MKKINTRLSFNTNGWHLPSGAVGKSRNLIHEQIYSFGFEEWLFNKSFSQIDENGVTWHFGYIEGIHKNYRSSDENYTLQLFTIDKRTGNRYIVAEIFEWQKLSPNDSENLINQNIHLINQMHNDLINLENPNAIGKFLEHQNNQNKHQLFNIKFKDFSYCYNINEPLERTNRIYNLHRFWLYR